MYLSLLWLLVIISLVSDTMLATDTGDDIPSFDDDMVADNVIPFADIKEGGDDAILSRQKRATIPSDMVFSLTVVNPPATVKVGTQLQLKLIVTFPTGTEYIVIEMFAPTVTTTMMHICDVKVVSVGSNLSPDPTAEPVSYDGKENEKHLYDHARLILGSITNSGANTADLTASQVVIQFTATMVYNKDMKDGETYWVNAGAAHHNGEKIWIGQAGITAKVTSEVTTLRPILEISGPDEINVGSSAVFQVQAKVPQRYVAIEVEVIAAYTHPVPYSISDVTLGNVGANILCPARDTQTACLTRHEGDRGNWKAILTLPQVVNTRSNVDSALVDDDIVKISVVIRAFEDTAIGVTYPVHIGVKFDSTTIHTATLNVTTKASTTPTSAPVSQISMANPLFPSGNKAKIGIPTVVRVEITIPTGMDTALILKVKSPVSTTTQFTVCNVKLASVGKNVAYTQFHDAVYSSIDGNTNYDLGTLDLGRVTDLNIGTESADRVIKVEMTVTALTHASNVLGSTQNVELSVGYGSSKYATKSVTLIVEAAPTPDAVVKPLLTLAYLFGGQKMSVGGIKAVLLEVTTKAGQRYTDVSIEFIMPDDANGPYVSLKKVTVVSVGANTPCVEASRLNKAIEFTDKTYPSLGTIVNRAKIAVGTLCNIGADKKNTASNIIQIVALIRMEKHSAWTAGEAKYISAGMSYSNQALWLGQIALYQETSGLVIEKVSDAPYINADTAGSHCEIPPEYPADYTINIKIPPYSTMPYGLTVTPADPNDVSLCDLQLKSIGKSLIYTKTDFASKITVSKDKMVANIDTVTNPVMSRFLANSVVDDTSLTFSLKLKVNKTAIAGSKHTVNIVLCLGGESVNGELTVTVTDDVSGIAVATTADTMQISNTAVKLTDNTANAANIAPGETRRLITELVMDEATATNKIAVHIASSSSNNQRLELVNIGLIQVGDNYKCLDRSTIPLATLSTRTVDGINELGSLHLGYFCYSKPKYTSENADANKMLVESIFRLVDTDSGSGSLDVDIVLAMNADKNITKTFTWTGSSSFTTPKNQPYTFADPATAVDVLNTTLDINIRQRFSIIVNAQMPPLRAMDVTSLVTTPVKDTAVLTLHKVKLLCAGVNIASLNSASNPIENNFKSTLKNSQMNSVETKYGIITNTGFSTRALVGQGDNDNDHITLEIEMELTDNVLTEHATKHEVSVTFTWGVETITAKKEVTVVRDNGEQAKLTFLAEVEDKVYTSGDAVTISMSLDHKPDSQAEPHNVLVAIYLPPFMESLNHTASLTPAAYQDTGSSLRFTYDSFLFTDSLKLTVNLKPKSDVSTPVATSLAVTPVELVYNLHHRAGSSFTDGQDFAEMHGLSYRVSNNLQANQCSEPLGMASGNIKDCQLTAFLSADDAHGPTKARITSTGWAPFMRSSPFDKHRYLQIAFGNKVRVTKLKLKRPAGSPATVVTKLQLAYSNEGKAWFKGVEFVPDPSYAEDLVVLKPRISRYLRLYVNDHNGQDEDMVVFTVELYGCQTTTDVDVFSMDHDSPRVRLCQNGVIDIFFSRCVLAGANIISTPGHVIAEFYKRGMLRAGTKLYFCDINPEKHLKPHCFVTDEASSGRTWTSLDKRVGSVIGHDKQTNEVYAVSNDGLAYMSSEDGRMWFTSQPSQWAARKGSKDTVKAMEIPWVSHNLDGSSPHADYTIDDTWGATFYGIHYKTAGTWTKVLDWSACCV